MSAKTKEQSRGYMVKFLASHPNYIKEYQQKNKEKIAENMRRYRANKRVRELRKILSICELCHKPVDIHDFLCDECVDTYWKIQKACAY